MIQMLRKRKNLKKMKSKSSTPEIRSFSLISVLKRSAKFILVYKKTFLVWSFVNFLFLFVFSLIPNGWTNSLSILWLVLYYIYWCIFIRFVQKHVPYFSLIRIFNGLIPASKIMFINISIYMLIIITPFILMFMGFDGKFLEFFERYMELIQSHHSLPGITLFYIFMLLISPYTLTRPYLAWICSLVGKNRSIIDAYKRTKGNYINFVYCAITLSVVLILSYYVDATYKTNVTMYLMSFFLVYLNIVFINIYKIFYKNSTRN